MKSTHTTRFIAGTLGAALTLTIGCAQAPVVPPAAATHGAHWSYEGATGPTHWAQLPDCATCGLGKAQSPIDLLKSAPRSGAAPALAYGTTSLRIAHHQNVTELVDNGHTIQVTVDKGSTFTTARGTYQLKQFHFHTPSEHTFEGRHLPMEVHFVHQSAEGRLAVLGIMVVEGPANPNLARLIANFPAGRGQSAHRPTETLELGRHLPTDKTAYTYMGSLTTPPCSENVEWYVLREPVPASREQLAVFAARLGKNHRPVQLLNGRAVETVTIDAKE